MDSAGVAQGPRTETPPKPITLANLQGLNSYHRVENLCRMLLRDGELADYDDELANTVKIVEKIACGLDALSQRAKQARHYAEQLGAHMDEGGKYTERNVRDLLDFIKQIA